MILEGLYYDSSQSLRSKNFISPKSSTLFQGDTQQALALCVLLLSAARQGKPLCLSRRNGLTFQIQTVDGNTVLFLFAFVAVVTNRWI
jgi:hypothetical protein